MASQNFVDEMLDVLNDIDEQMKVVEQTAARKGLSKHQIFDQNGNFLYTPLLLARSNILLGLAKLSKGSK